MKFFLKSGLVVLGLSFVASCAESEFASSTKREKKSGGQNSGDLTDIGSDTVGLDGNIVHIPSTADGKLPDGVTIGAGGDGSASTVGKSGKGLDITLDPIKRSLSGGAVTSVPVDFYFAIDVTGSMQRNINTIKDNIEDFANELEKKKYRARLSLVPFRDRVESIMEPTSDINKFKSEVAGQFASGGGDANEAALGAVDAAIKKIKETKSPGAFAAVIAITDNPAHMGGSTTNCDINPLLDTINSLSEADQMKTKIYGSFANSGVNCSGFGSAKEQFSQILDRSLIASPISQRGSANLSYPFEKGTILDELVPLVEKTIPSKQLICLADSAELSVEGTSLSTWKTPSLEESYARFVKDVKVAWPDAIKDGELEKYVGKTLDVEIKRCCVSQEDAAAGNFGGCIDDIQKVNLDIK